MTAAEDSGGLPAAGVFSSSAEAQPQGGEAQAANRAGAGATLSTSRVARPEAR